MRQIARSCVRQNPEVEVQDSNNRSVFFFFCNNTKQCPPYPKKGRGGGSFKITPGVTFDSLSLIIKKKLVFRKI